MALQSLMVPIGTPAPDFDLESVDGTRLALRDVSAPVLLVAFLCNHCPYVRHVEAELGRVTAEFADRGVETVGVCSNDTDAYPEDDAAHLRDQLTRAAWSFPYLLDSSQQVGRAYQAACTPDFFVYDRDRRLAYRGAMDDSSPRNGEPNDGRYLRRALALVLAGEKVPEPHVPSMGCSIKWRQG